MLQERQPREVLVVNDELYVGGFPQVNEMLTRHGYWKIGTSENEHVLGMYVNRHGHEIVVLSKDMREDKLNDPSRKMTLSDVLGEHA